jgi:anthranilate synthase
LGDSEYLIGASPEMYVRSKNKRIETCPISGTIQRGDSAIEDAANVKLLLNSAKEESELTMFDPTPICIKFVQNLQLLFKLTI